MARVLTDNKYYSQIADVIREQNGTSNTYTPPQMVSALKDLFYEEVEGVPPITFQGIGENLLNYRIDGASGGVGDRTNNLFDKNNPTMLTELYISVTGLVNVTSSNSRSIVIPCTPATTYSIKFKYETYTLRIASFSSYPTVNKVGNDVNNVANGTPCNNASYTTSETANYLLIFCYNVATHESSNYSIDEFFSEIIVSESQIPLPYDPYGYKVPVVVSGKNLFNELQVVDTTVSSEMSNYQIFKQNGKLLINGLTTSSQSDVEIANINSINNQALQFINSNENQYNFLTAVPGRIMIRYKLNGSDVVRYTFDEYNSSNRVADRIVFRLQQNYQYNNEQMNIMFKLKQIQSDNYEPYHEPTTTNIYLDEPIEENESISLSDTNVNIPTIRGTNVLTVDTTIQPSNVYVKSRHESSYEAAMRERYEEAQAQLDALESEGE